MTPEIILHPLLPPWMLAAVLVPAILLLVVALLRRARGTVLRALALLALGGALLDPRMVREEREPRPDVALLVVDDSLSQHIGNRRQTAEAALASARAQLDGLDGVETRILRAEASPAGETRLFETIERAVLDGIGERLAGIIIISDGQIHDVPAAKPDWLNAPVHLLLTGAKDERDRRIVIAQAPAYGLVNDSIEVAFRVEEMGRRAESDGRVLLQMRVNGIDAGTTPAEIGEMETVSVPIRHAGASVVELEVAPAPGEVSTINNRAAVAINGVRERLRVLLVSGQPHPGERTWRNLLKSDPSVDLVHFTILRPPEKDDATPLRELSLIVFPVQELFETKLYDFDLVVFDRYAVRGILPLPYYARLGDYVRQGGALLLAAGPEFAGAQSLFRTPLGDILPVDTNGRVLERPFRPQVTDIGRRHPVTAGLPGERVAGDAELGETASGPSWGRWFRLVEGTVRSGIVLMTGAGEQPLLIVDRVGEGRVAQLMSDHIWLWARGFDGGGPHAELLRRLAHWLMQEPELEEEHLEARTVEGRLEVRRRSLEAGPRNVTVTGPTGSTKELVLEPGPDGIGRADLPATETGLWRVSDGDRTAFAAAGRLDPPELLDLRATPGRLAPLVAATGGGITWLSDGIPEFRRTAAERDAAGRDWLGLQRNRAYELTGRSEVPLLPALLLLAATVGGLAGAWWREGR